MTKQAINTINYQTIGTTEETVKNIEAWFTDTRVKECNSALAMWMQIGDLCARIKTIKEGKFSDNCKEILGIELSNDERQYSMKLYENKKAVLDWTATFPHFKYNPRTIYTAWQNSLKPAPTKEEKEAEKAEKAEKVLRAERKGADAIKALVEYRKIRNKAAEDGNLVLGDLETLRQELENELKEICEAIALEAPVQEVAQGKKAARLETMKKLVGKAA